MNPSKAKGTFAESAIVAYLQNHGWPHAERRALAGAYDKGDITGTIGICWESKGGTAGETCAPADLKAWMAEVAEETRNARADYGVLVTKRTGFGEARAGQWWAFLDSHDLAELLTGREARGPRFTVRMTLAEVVVVLRHAGYGDELAVVA